LTSRLAICALVLAGCGRTGLVDPAVADGGSTPPPVNACSTKITFPQATGCLNDGAIEICAKDDPSTALELFVLAPGTLPTGTQGRCPAPSVAYLWPLVPQEDWCVDSRGAMNDAAWKIVCEVAARSDVSVVAPFWSE
jgi:hypothetical protein